MFPQTWFSVIFLISTFAIRDSLQINQVKTWSEFQAILATNKGPIALLVSYAKIAAADTQALEGYCKTYSKCACYQALDSETSTFTEHFGTHNHPIFAFYNNGQEVKVLKQTSTKTSDVTASVIDPAFQQICPSDGKSPGGGNNPNGGKAPGGNPNGGNPPGGNPNGGNPNGGNPPGGNPNGGNPPGGK